MKTLIVSFYYFPELGAAPSRITNMAEGLQKEGMEVDILTCLPNYPKGKIFDGYTGKFYLSEKLNGINIFRYWTFATVSKNPLLRILNMLCFSFLLWCFAWKRKRINSYDTIIIQSPPIMVAYSAMVLFKKIFKKKVVLNVSDLWPMSAVDLGAVKEGSLYHKVLSYMERFIYKNADAVQGQSNEILKHVEEFEPQKPLFLYRNLQQDEEMGETTSAQKGKTLKIVYAGLLGVAQDMLSLIKAIDFKAINAELHLYGGGNQTQKIEQYIAEHQTGVVYHGYRSKEEINQVLKEYDASIVPLAVHIKGAVPSKIFNLLPAGIPILLCGSGEAAEIVENYKIGYTSQPQDYKSLKENILRLSQLTDEEYQAIKENCLHASRTDFNFDTQMKKYAQFLRSL